MVRRCERYVKPQRVPAIITQQVATIVIVGHASSARVTGVSQTKLNYWYERSRDRCNVRRPS